MIWLLLLASYVEDIWRAPQQHVITEDTILFCVAQLSVHSTHLYVAIGKDAGSEKVYDYRALPNEKYSRKMIIMTEQPMLIRNCCLLFYFRIKEEPGITETVSNFFEVTDKEESDDEDVKDIKCDPVKVEAPEKLHNPLCSGPEKLPSLLEATASRIGTSVFVNPFEEAEQAKNHILEKHVKLTQAAPKKPAHQPVCWKFKKGKCHLGKNCRFFHDRENSVTEEDSHASGNPTPVQTSYRQVYHPSAYIDAHKRPLEQEPLDEDNYMASVNKKKRFGMTDNLVPPKRAFELLQRQREIERPWTVPQK